MLAEEEVLGLCAVLETTQVKCRIGNAGLPRLLVKNLNKTLDVATNLRGITI